VSKAQTKLKTAKSLTFCVELIIFYRYLYNVTLRYAFTCISAEKTTVATNSSQILHEYASLTAVETKDHIELSLETMAPVRLRRPAQLRHPEPEPQAWRGVFAPAYKWKTLFSQQVKIRTTKLPRLKPYITIDRRTLTSF